MSVDVTELSSAPPGPVGPAEHSHVGGRTVYVGGPAHLHPVGSSNPADHPVPTGREEVWRFTPLRRLRGLHADAPFTADPVTATWTAPDGVSVRELSGPNAEQAKADSPFAPIDRPSLRAFTEATRVIRVDIPAQTTAADPIEIELHGQDSDTGAATAGHVIIRAGRFATATVVLRYLGVATLVDNVEIVAEDGAAVTVVAIDDWSPAAVHLTSHHLSVGRDARITHGLLSFGGDLVRATVSVDYTAPGGDVEMLGVSFADAGQHLEHRLFVDHDAPHCKSRVLYKSALQGAGAHTVWVGDVLIRASAEGTDTYELNRNLLLTDGCRADSVPNLEIETGEIVGAGHASATGRFDDDQLFYLLSRGIPEAVARRLVVRGFFHEVLTRLGVPSVVERTLSTIERELEISGN